MNVETMKDDQWHEMNVPISDVKRLLNENYEIEVTSPDGWVPVTAFVNKGEWKEYVLSTDCGEIRCNENHLFETDIGWKYACELAGLNGFKFLSDNGTFISGKVKKTGEVIPIVDIQVDHPNHRYFTNGISSHNTNVGKSLVLCHLAGSYLAQGKNVLYITLEMSEERIAERIDANLFDVPLEQVEELPRDVFESKVKKIAAKTHGKLIIKEYPTAAAHSGHFRALLNELKLKRNFIPEVIFVDYIGICSSARVKGLSTAVNTNSFVKAVSEELRGLAIEFNVPLWTATQVNRQGFTTSDPEMTDIADSFALTGTADFMISLTETEQLEKLGQYLVKQLKNRYNNKANNKRFIVGVDKSKMRLYDVNNSGQTIIGSSTSDGPTPQTPKPWDKGRKAISISNIKV
jgi:DnaB-like helicase C terminal domain